MKYRDTLLSSAAWLLEAQNPDGGWGLVPGQASALVCTAEAAYVLRRAGQAKAHNRALSFLQSNLRNYYDRFGKRTRYSAFTLFALADGGLGCSDPNILECVNRLVEAQRIDGAWGAESSSGRPCLFSTFLAIWALRSAGHADTAIARGQQWLLAAASEAGWSLEPELPPSPTATAYACLALSRSSLSQHRLSVALSQLSQPEIWSRCDEIVVAGTTWKHCHFAFALPALMHLGVPAHSPEVASAIHHIATLRNEKGVWSEGQAPFFQQTIRAQFWAVHALESVCLAFDPLIDTAPALTARFSTKEASTIRFASNSTWEVTLSIRAFQLLTLLPVIASLSLLLGVGELFESRLVADSAALALLVLSFVLIRARKEVFPKTARVLQYAMSIFAALNLTLGLSGLSAVATLREWSDSILKMASW